MSIALLGLVFIQFYWIDSAIVLKKDEFNQKVVFAMRNVIHKLEKKEAMEQMRRHQLGSSSNAQRAVELGAIAIDLNFSTYGFFETVLNFIFIIIWVNDKL